MSVLRDDKISVKESKKNVLKILKQNEIENVGTLKLHCASNIEWTAYD